MQPSDGSLLTGVGPAVDVSALIDRIEVIDLAAGPVAEGDDRYAVAVHAAGQAGFYGPIGELVAALIRAGLGTCVLGHRVGDHRGLHRKLTGRLGAHGGGLGAWAIGAIDCAVWDLHGRLTGRPVADLLGAPVAGSGARVPVYASWPGADLTQPGLRAEVTRLAEEGYLFTKWGLRRDRRLAPGRAAAVMAAAVERASIWAGSPVAVDAVGTWDPTTTALFADRVNAAALHWVEDPLPETHVDLYAELTGRCALPLAIGERLVGPRQAARLLTATSPAAFVVDVVWCGGLTTAVDLVHLAGTCGITLFPHGRALAPALHLACAYPDLVGAVEYQVQWEPRRQALFTTLLPVVEGHIGLPDEPGLGRTPRRTAP
ncbi:enolase C-terminal domain-like protein [Nonomuraea sp. NPDC003754]